MELNNILERKHLHPRWRSGWRSGPTDGHALLLNNRRRDLLLLTTLTLVFLLQSRKTSSFGRIFLPGGTEKSMARRQPPESFEKAYAQQELPVGPPIGGRGSGNSASRAD